MLATFIALIKVYHVVNVIKSAVLLCNKRNGVINHQLYCKFCIVAIRNRVTKDRSNIQNKQYSKFNTIWPQTIV